jgi:hypothetical protein
MFITLKETVGDHKIKGGRKVKTFCNAMAASTAHVSP